MVTQVAKKLPLESNNLMLTALKKAAEEAAFFIYGVATGSSDILAFKPCCIMHLALVLTDVRTSFGFQKF